MSTYTSFTNDIDRQVVADLDSASLGLRYNDPSDSIFTAGKAAMGVLPEMMQLGEVMKSRAALNDSSMEKRRLIGVDQSAVEDQGVFDAYAKDLDQLAGITDPAQRAQALADMNQKDPRRMLNKDVQESMRVLREADKSVTDAANSGVARRQAALANKGLDRDERIEREIGDDMETKAIASFRFEDEKFKADQHRWRAVQEAGENQRQDLANSAISQSSLPRESIEDGVSLLAVIGNSDESAGTLSGVAGLFAATEQAMRVESSFNPFLEKHKPTEATLAKGGVTAKDLEAAATDPAAMAKIVKAVGNSPQASRDLSEYYNLVSQKRQAMKDRTAMEEYITGKVDPETGVRSEGALKRLTRLFEAGDMNAFKKERAVFSSRVQPLAALNRQALVDREADVKRREEGLKLSKLEGDLLNQTSIIENRTAQRNLTEFVLLAKKQNLNETNAEQLTQAALRSKVLKVSGTAEDKAKQIADFQSALKALLIAEAANTPLPGHHSAPTEE